MKWSPVSMSKAELRKAMHDFINDDLDPTPLAADDLNSDFSDRTTDVEDVRKLLHWIGESMDFHDVDLHGNTQGCSGYGSSEFAGETDVDDLFFKMCTKASPCFTLPRSLQQRLIREARHHIWLQNRELLQFHLSEWRSVKLEDKMEFLLVKAFQYRDSMLPERERERDEFLETESLQPPLVLRLIDVAATCSASMVTLIDYWADATVRQVGYSAVSHTYGYDVYEVFDCPCATKCSANVLHPRCSQRRSSHAGGKAAQESVDTRKHNRVVNDILRMCAILSAAGVQYAWHDGVCIKQCDEEELTAAIKCIGWIYSSANETVVFLHYVGMPMAPIRNGDVEDDLTCRWQTRVWTLQEAALSKCRRYCVRVGMSPLGHSQSLEEFERRIDLLYNDDTSKIEVIEEQKFCEIMLTEIGGELEPLFNQIVTEIGEALELLRIALINEVGIMDELNWLSCLKARIRMARKACTWSNCIFSFYTTLLLTCFQFPTAKQAIELCSRRESKHVGDRINSILALSGVKDFVAKKEASCLEASTIEFFKRQGRKGLELAVFTANELFNNEDRLHINKSSQHTWPPLLQSGLATVMHGESCLQYRVLDNGMVEMQGELLCLKVEFTLKLEDGEGESSSAISQDRPSDAHTKILACHDHLDMVLTRNGVRHIATFPQAPECPIGSAIIPSFHVGKTTCRFQAHLVMPVEFACEESHFRAFLDLPKGTILNSEEINRWPALLVQGDLHNYVEKMGCFKLCPLLVLYGKHLLDRPAFTVLKKLIIK